MSKPRIVSMLVFVMVALAIGGAYPWIHRHTRRSELELSASNFCTCMLGRPTGDVHRTLEGVRLSVSIDPPVTRWPERCKPFARTAVDAMQAAWRADVEGAPDESWGDVADEVGKGNELYAAKVLDALRPFWTQDPDPSVPIAPDVVVPRIDPRTPLFFEGSIQTLDIGDEGIIVSGNGPRCALDETLHGTCAAASRPRSVLENDPDVRVRWDAGRFRFLREDGSLLVDFPKVELAWGHAYAGDRLVVVDVEGTLYEHARGKLEKQENAIRTDQRSTQFVEGWAVWKDTAVTPALVVARKLADGVRGKTIPLGLVGARPAPASARTYGVCRARSIFVDLDPHLAVLSNGTWSMVERTWPRDGRHVDCNGDAAIVTDFHPPYVERCDRSSCLPIPLPPLEGSTEDEFLATETSLYQVERRTAVVLSIRDLASGGERRVPLMASNDVRLYRDHDVLHVLHGHVVATIVRQDGRVHVLSVDRDGSTRVLRAGE